MARDVTARTATASAALLGARIFVKVIDLVLILILARILVPEDFALVALATIFIQFTESILEIPVIQALIRAPRVNDKMLDTAFTISLLRALLVALAVIAMAPVAIHVFNEPRLGLLMAFLALSPALRGLVNPRLVMFARRLNYFPEATIDVIAKIVTAAIAIPLAIQTKSYWSLAIMTVLTPVTMIVGSYIVAPYRPRLSLKEWPVFANMISWQTISQIFVAANWQADIFIIGRGVAADIVGKYSMSQTLAGAPNQVFVVPISRPFVAAFAELREPAAIRPGYRTAMSAVFTAVAPILALIIFLAEPIVNLLFNEAWEGATLFLTFLSLSALIQLPAQPVYSLVLALDQARLNALQALIGLAIKAPLLFFGLKYFGINGFLAGQIIGVTAWMITGAFIVKHLIKLTILEQAAAVFRPVLALAAMGVVIYGLRFALDYSSPFLIIVTAGFVGGVSFLVYGASIFGLWRLAGRPDGIEKLVFNGVAKLSSRFAAGGAST